MSSLKNYLKIVIREHCDIDAGEVQLDAKVLIFFVPSWTCMTSKHAKELAKQDFASLYDMTREQLYPEIYRLQGEEQANALYRHHMEVAALDNFISYYLELPLDEEQDFSILFEPFIYNTCKDGICLTGYVSHFQDAGVTYMLPTLHLLELVVNNQSNPYNNQPLQPETCQRIRERYKLELKMLYP